VINFYIEVSAAFPKFEYHLLTKFYLNVSKSAFSFLHQLSMWHFPYLMLRPCCGATTAERRHLLHGAHAEALAGQHTRSSGMQRANDGTDRRTPDRYIDPAPCTMRAVPITVTDLWSKFVFRPRGGRRHLAFRKRHKLQA